MSVAISSSLCTLHLFVLLRLISLFMEREMDLSYFNEKFFIKAGISLTDFNIGEDKKSIHF